MRRGVNAPHRRSNAQDDLDGMPHVSMDYGFSGERDSEEKTSPVLVIRERRHNITWAMLVQRKETEFHWIAKGAAKFIDQLGHNRVTFRCDTGPAIEALTREIAQARQEGSQTVPERPPVGESQSNGIVERAVRLVGGQARTLEHRTGAKVPPDARMLCWLVEFLQRLHGRRDNTPILEFGEKPVASRDSILECSLECSIRPQRQWFSPSKERRSRHARPTSGESPSRKDGTRTEHCEYDPSHGLQMAATTHSTSKSEWRGTRRWCLASQLMENKVATTYLRRADFEQWGLSEGRPGCRHLWTDQGRQQAHSEACRRRIEGLLRINRALADAAERHATFSLLRWVLSIRHETQHHHAHRAEHPHQRRDVAINQCLPCHKPVTRLRVSDNQDCGPRRTFRHSGQGHRKLVVQLDELIVFGVATIGPCLGCSECPFRNPLYQLLRLVLWVDISQARGDLALGPSGVLPDQLFG